MNRNNIFIILLLQATYTVQEKEFIFPSEIQALIDSCVEIPCTVRTSATEPKNDKVVWHIVKLFPGSRIVYSSDPSEISNEYKNRAALIGSPEDSCSLRIHKVTKKDEKEYYPGDRKLPHRRKVSEHVQLLVTDVPPQPVLSVPEDIVHGTPTLVTCSVEHTCATSPPFLTWNISGLPLTEYNKDLGNGKYLKTSELTYLPTSRDYKNSSILCMATFPNGQTSRTAAKLNIIEVEKNVNRDFRMGIIVACLISLLLVAFFIWRFLLGNKASTSRTPNLIRIKNDSFGTKGTKETRYTDLMKRDNSVYCVIEPATQKMIQGKTHLPEYANIYEDMRPPYTGISK